MEIVAVLAILVTAVILFVTEKFSPDIVALLTIVALLLSRVLDIADALAGFANPAVITIAAIFVVTAGLTNTGVASWFGGYLFRIAGKNETRLIGLTMGASAMLSLVMNNIASASVLLPGLSSIARRNQISPSKLMIPLSFGTLLGGMATLFTTVNLLANAALRHKGLVPFSLWDFFRIGSILLIAGIAYMVIVGRRFLPDHPAKERIRVPGQRDLIKLYRLPDLFFEISIPKGSPLDGKTISESRLGRDFNLNIIGILRGRKLKLAPEANERLLSEDRLMIEGDQGLVREAGEKAGLAIESSRSATDVKLADRNVGIVEVLISPHAGIEGRSLREIHFRRKFGIAALAILREGIPIVRRVADTPLHFGDTLLAQGPRSRIKLLNEERDFIVLQEPGYFGEIGRPDKAPWALAAMGLMLLTAGFSILPIAAASLVGALAMILSGALKTDEGYKAIEWKAVVMIGGMLSLGTALEKSGAADLISHNLLHMLEPMGQVAVLAGFFIASLLLAQILSGVATAVLIIPIALSTATQLNVSAYPLVMTVVLGVSSGFLTPVSHPVNVLVMGPGGYRFSDFARVGAFLSLIIFVLVIVLVPRFWPF